MTAMLIDGKAVAGAVRVTRLRPSRSQVRTRAAADPRRRARLGAASVVLQPVASCAVERPRPRVTLAESVVPVSGAWRLTERGLAVLVLGVLLAFGSGVAVMVVQFLSITAG